MAKDERDAFCDYGGADNVVTALTNIALAIERVAKALEAGNRLF